MLPAPPPTQANRYGVLLLLTYLLTCAHEDGGAAHEAARLDHVALHLAVQHILQQKLDVDEAAQPLLRVRPIDTPRALPDLPVRLAALGVFTARLGERWTDAQAACCSGEGRLGIDGVRAVRRWGIGEVCIVSRA